MAELPPKHDVFQAIADPTRRSLLQLLAEKEMSVAAIKKCFSISRTAVNKHLQVLLDAGLASSRKAGRETLYKLIPEPLKEIKEWFAFFDQMWDEKLAALKKYVEDDMEF